MHASTRELCCLLLLLSTTRAAATSTPAPTAAAAVAARHRCCQGEMAGGGGGARRPGRHRSGRLHHPHTHTPTLLSLSPSQCISPLITPSSPSSAKILYTRINQTKLTKILVCNNHNKNHWGPILIFVRELERYYRQQIFAADIFRVWEIVFLATADRLYHQNPWTLPIPTLFDKEIK